MKLFIAGIMCLFALPAMAQTATDIQKSQVTATSNMQKNFKLTKKQFMDQSEKSFDAMDKNHDGVLTMDELTGGAQMPNMPAQPASPPPILTQTPPAPTTKIVETPVQKPAINNPTTSQPIAPITGIPPVNR